MFFVQPIELAALPWEGYSMYVETGREIVSSPLDLSRVVKGEEWNSLLHTRAFPQFWMPQTSLLHLRISYSRKDHSPKLKVTLGCVQARKDISTHKCSYSCLWTQLERENPGERDKSSFLVLTETHNGDQGRRQKEELWACHYSRIQLGDTPLPLQGRTCLPISDMCHFICTQKISGEMTSQLHLKTLPPSSWHEVLPVVPPRQWESISSLQVLGQTLLSHSSALTSVTK